MASLDVPGPGRLRSRRETVSREAQREASQRKAFSRWMNTYLSDALKVETLDTDLRDGTRLVALAHALTGTERKGGAAGGGGAAPAAPLGDIQILDNHAVWMKMIKDAGCTLNNIQAGEIAAGNAKITLALVWSLIVHFQLSRDVSLAAAKDGAAAAPRSTKSAKQRLLEWVADVTEGMLDRPAPRNFDQDWSDGALFLALVKYARPDLVDLDADVAQVDADAAMRNLGLAFDLAEKHLRLPRLLDTADVAMHPDEMAVMTYVSYFRNPPPVVVRDESLEARCTELEALVARLTEDNDNLRRAIRDSEAGAVEARALASQSAAERDAAIAEKLTTAEAHSKLAHDYERGKAKQQSQKEQLDVLEARCAELQTALEVIPGLEKQIGQYEDMLRDRENEAQLTEEQVREKEALLARLGGQSKELSARIAEQDSRMESLQERVERNRLEREAAERERLEAEAREADDQRELSARLARRREEILAFFREGCVLWKYTHGGKGKAHERYFTLDPDRLELCWSEKKDQTKGMRKVLVRGVHRGSTVTNNPSEHEALTFTIISPNYAGLALRAKSSMAYAMFVEGIPMIIEDQETGTKGSVPVPYVNAVTGDVVLATSSPSAGPIGRRSMAPPDGYDPPADETDLEVQRVNTSAGDAKGGEAADDGSKARVIAGSPESEEVRVIATNSEAAPEPSGKDKDKGRRSRASSRREDDRGRALSDLTVRVVDGVDINGDDVTVVGNITVAGAAGADQEDGGAPRPDSPDLHVEHVEGKKKKKHKKKEKGGDASPSDVASDGSDSEGLGPIGSDGTPLKATEK